MTGGATGLGLGMAEALKSLGCTVSIWGRRQDVVAKAAGELGAHSQICDVADKKAVDAAMAVHQRAENIVLGIVAVLFRQGHGVGDDIGGGRFRLLFVRRHL